MAERRGLAALLAEQDAQFAEGDTFGTAAPSAEQQRIFDQNERLSGMARGDYMTDEFGEVDTSMGEYQSALQLGLRRGAEGGASMLRGQGYVEQAEGRAEGVSDTWQGQLGETVSGLARKIDVNPTERGHMQDLAGGLGSSLPFFAGQAVAGVGTLALTKSPQLATAAGTSAAAYLGRGAMMDEMVQDFKRTTGREPNADELQTMSDESQWGYAEAAPIGHGFGRAVGALGKTADGFVKHALKTGAVEGVEEIIQEGGLGVIKNKVAKEKLAYDEDRNLFEGVAESAAMGGEVGFIMGAAMSMLGARTRYKQKMYDEALTGAAEEESLSTTQKATKEVNEKLKKSTEAYQKEQAKAREKVAVDYKVEQEAKLKKKQDAAVDKAVENIPPEQRIRGTEKKPLQTDAAKAVRAQKAKRAAKTGATPTAQETVTAKVETLPNVSQGVKDIEQGKVEKAPEPIKAKTPEVASIAQTIKDTTPTPVQSVESLPKASVSTAKNAETVVQTIGAVTQRAVDETVAFDETSPSVTEVPQTLTEEAPVTEETPGDVTAMQSEKQRLLKELEGIATTMGKKQNNLDYIESEPNKKGELDSTTKEIKARRKEYNVALKKLREVSLKLQKSRADLEEGYTPMSATEISNEISKWTAKIINEHKNRPAAPETITPVATKSEEEIEGVQTMNAIDETLKAHTEEDPVARAQSILKNRKISIPKLKKALSYMGIDYTARENKATLLNKYMLHSKKFNRTPAQNLQAISNLVKAGDKVNGMTKKMEAEYSRIYKALYGVAMNKFYTIENMEERTKAAVAYVDKRIDEVAYGGENLTVEDKQSAAEQNADEIISALKEKGFKVSGDNKAVLLKKDATPDSFIADELPMSPNDVAEAKAKLEAMFMQTTTNAAGEPTTSIRITKGASLTVPWQEVAAYGEAVADGSLGIRIVSGGKLGADKFILKFGKLTNPTKQLAKHPLSAVKGIVTEDYVTRDDIMSFDKDIGRDTNVFTADEFGIESAAQSMEAQMQPDPVSEMSIDDAYENFQMEQTADNREASGLPTLEEDIVTDDFFGAPPGKPSEGATPQPKSSAEKRAEREAKRAAADKEAEALRKEVYDLEDSGYVQDDDVILDDFQAAAKTPRDSFLVDSVYKEPFYHYMTQPWQFVDLLQTELGIHLGTEQAAKDRAKAQRTIDMDTHDGRGEGQVKEFVIKVKKPFIWRDINYFGDPENIYRELLKDKGSKRIPKMPSSFWKDMRKVYLAWKESQRSRPSMEHDAREKVFQPLIRQAFLEAGYDAIEYKNAAEDAGSTSVIIFKPESLKTTEASNYNDTNDILDHYNWHGGKELEGGEFSHKYSKSGTGGNIQGFGIYVAEKLGVSKYYKQLVDEKGDANEAVFYDKEGNELPQNEDIGVDVIGQIVYGQMDDRDWDPLIEGILEDFWKPADFFMYNFNPPQGGVSESAAEFLYISITKQIQKAVDRRYVVDKMDYFSGTPTQVNSGAAEYNAAIDRQAAEDTQRVIEHGLKPGGPLEFIYNLDEDQIQTIEKPEGQLYRTEIKAPKDQFLQWDLKGHMQSPHIKKILNNFKPKFTLESRLEKDEYTEYEQEWHRPVYDFGKSLKTGEPVVGYGQWTPGSEAFVRKDIEDQTTAGSEIVPWNWKSLSGEELYKAIVLNLKRNVKSITMDKHGRKLDSAWGDLGYVEASSFLYDLGIKGNKYFDADSRKSAKGSENFVVFSDKDVVPNYKIKQEKEVTHIEYISDEAKDASKFEMPDADIAKAKKFAGQFQKGAAKNGLNLTVLWTGKESMPGGFKKKIDELVRDRNFVRLDGTRGWINLKTKEVIIFPRNMESLEAFKKTMFHEVIGHFSMEQMFGNDFNTLLDNMTKNSHWKPLIDAKMTEYNSVRKPEHWISERVAAKEVIANLAESNTNPALLKRIIAWVRHQLRRLGLNIDIAENDIINYIRKAGQSFEAGTLPRTDYYSEIMDSYVGDLVNGGMVSDLDAIENKRTMKGVIDMLNSGAIPDIDELSGTAWAKMIKPTWDNVSKSKYFNWYSHLKGMDFQKTYQYVRQLGLGISSNYDRRAAGIFKGLKGLNQDQKSILHEFFTTAGAELPADWGTDKETALANDAKQIIFDLGQELVDFEYLDPDTFAANADSYLPRMYLAFVIDPQKAAAIYGGGSKVSLQNYLKEIKLKIEEGGGNAAEIAEIQKAMGMIDDPVMLATNSIAMVGRDVALLQMLEGVSYASESMGGKTWVVPKMKGIQLPGMTKPKDPMTILAEVEKNRKNVLGFTTGDKKRTTARLYDVQETAARQALQAVPNGDMTIDLSEMNINDYKYIETSRRNGALSGRWIRKEIYNDIRASYVAFASEDPSGFEAVFGQYSGLTKANRIWKNTKTVWNVPTHARNFIGNFVNMDISTATSTPKLMKMVSEEMVTFLEATINETPVSELPYYWRVADKLGITETTFTAQEAQTALREWKKAIKDSKDWTEGIPNNAAVRFLAEKMPMMSQKGVRMADIMGGMYQASETLFKVVKLRDTIERYEAQMGINLEGLDDITKRDAIESMAVQDAQKWIFDYSAVPRTVRYLRNAPIGAPFISFAYLALPRMFEAAAKHPLKMTQYTMAPFVLGHIAAMLGAFPEDDDDWNKVKAKLPDYMKDKNTILPLPWRDEYGNRTFVDIGYFIPFSPYIEAGRAYTQKFITNTKPDLPLTDPILNMGILSGPTPDLITAWKTGIDPFTQQPIIDPYGTPLDKTVDGLNYAWSMAAPTFLTSKGYLGKTIQMLTDANKNYNTRTRERKQDLVSSQLSLVGVNVTSPNLRDSRQTNIRYMKSEMSKIKASATRKVKQARAAGASPQEIADIRKPYTEKLKLYRKNINDYRGESQ